MVDGNDEPQERGRERRRGRRGGKRGAKGYNEIDGVWLCGKAPHEQGGVSYCLKEDWLESSIQSSSHYILI